MEAKRPYKLEHGYPGLRLRDEVIWDAFILANPSAFQSVAYDVHVGEPAANAQERVRMMAIGAYEVSQWCVDVIAWDGSKEYVIEIKPNAGAGALGQALAYCELLVEAGLVGPSAVPVVLTDVISPITEQAARLLGVLILF